MHELSFEDAMMTLVCSGLVPKRLDVLEIELGFVEPFVAV